MTATIINAIPTTHHGVQFRSRLEADWALTLDAYGITWAYEPCPVTIGAVGYLCDLWLPQQNTWCEVKGPHGHRVKKTEDLASALRDEQPEALVIILCAATFGRATWVGALRDTDITLAECQRCGCNSFTDRSRPSPCRVCQAPEPWARRHRPSGTLSFGREIAQRST